MHLSGTVIFVACQISMPLNIRMATINKERITLFLTIFRYCLISLKVHRSPITMNGFELFRMVDVYGTPLLCRDAILSI